MDRYTTLRSFVLVADCGSFAAAAHKENVTPVVMGRRLDALERHLGVKLMHRSTRGLSLTDLGEQYLERARGLLKDFDEVDASISHDRTSVRGHLVVSAPAAFGRRHIGPHAPAFQAQAVLGVPQSLSLEQLQAQLETLADDLMVELKLQAED